MARKNQKKKESTYTIAYQNEQQSGLGGRKPRDLANTREYRLAIGQEFCSRFVFPYFSQQLVSSSVRLTILFSTTRLLVARHYTISIENDPPPVLWTHAQVGRRTVHHRVGGA